MRPNPGRAARLALLDLTAALHPEGHGAPPGSLLLEQLSCFRVRWLLFVTFLGHSHYPSTHRLKAHGPRLVTPAPTEMPLLVGSRLPATEGGQLQLRPKAVDTRLPPTTRVSPSLFIGLQSCGGGDLTAPSPTPFPAAFTVSLQAQSPGNVWVSHQPGGLWPLPLSGPPAAWLESCPGSLLDMQDLRPQICQRGNAC